MKKIPVLFSVLLMAVLSLAACSPGNNNVINDGSLTPGVDDTTGTEVVPGTGVDPLITPSLDGMDSITGVPTTTMITGDMTTPTARDMTTPAAGEDTMPATGTEVAPATDNAISECHPYQLTNYLDYGVVGAGGEVIGEVDGIVVYRDAALIPAVGAPDFSAFTAGQYANPVVAYFVVDFDDMAGLGNAGTLIPFSVFTALNSDTMPDDCRLAFANSYALDGSPVWDWDARPDLGVEDWDTAWSGFWSNLGVNVSVTAAGGRQLGNPVVFRDNFDDINVLNLNGEDLGEIEEFIIDPLTGELRYAVLAAGGFLGIGEKFVPIPMDQIIWGNYDDDNTDLGEIYINHPDDNWSEAPAIDDLEDVDFGVSTWGDEYAAYWKSLSGSTPMP